MVGARIGWYDTIHQNGSETGPDMHDPQEDTATTNGHVEHFEITEYTDEEAHAHFDAMARLFLNISGDEFRERWHRGDYDHDPDQPGVMTMALLLPLVERQEVAP